MELSYRKGQDAFVPAGAYRALEASLCEQSAELAEIPAVVLSCFDRSTRMLPFVLYDSWIFPAAARTVAAALAKAGFVRTRAVFQHWNPNFRPSQARLDGRVPQLLMLSSMQIHALKAYEAIHDAWSLGENRPLIFVGGPKAIYEPYHFWSMPDPDPNPSPTGRGAGVRELAAPDVVVTGEVFVLVELLNRLVAYRARGETMRTAFERARREGALESIPGLVYLAAEATLAEPVLVDTGLQRLVQHLDEVPNAAAGLSLLEPPHRGAGLSPAPLADSRVRRHSGIVSLLMTQGCKFNCPYCPIPALNQKSWRFRSPESLANEMAQVRERYGIKNFFGTDDNFFNRRQTAEEIFRGLVRARVDGRSLGTRIRWATEATQFDTFKNRDLLPLAKAAGLHSIWFGIEDLTANLINKGQKPEMTIELFRLLHQQKISPMAMMMYHDGQPFYSRDSLYGLANQIDFLRRAGAISVQCTVHTPAVGTREFEKAFATGRAFRTLGDYTIPQSKFDGNHVIMGGGEAAWLRQLKLLGGYAAFYNPWNLFRALKKDDSPLRRRRIGYQLAGFAATLFTAVKTFPYLLRLMLSRPTYYTEAPPLTTVPVRMPAQAFARLPVESPLISKEASTDVTGAENYQPAVAA